LRAKFARRSIVNNMSQESRRRVKQSSHKPATTPAIAIIAAREVPMGVVMIQCPRTGREIPTGIRMKRAEFERAPVFFARAYCPVCEREHEWFARDAWVREQPAPEPSHAL
jgi:hypothetical protein